MGFHLVIYFTGLSIFTQCLLSLYVCHNHVLSVPSRVTNFDTFCFHFCFLKLMSSKVFFSFCVVLFLCEYLQCVLLMLRFAVLDMKAALLALFFLEHPSGVDVVISIEALPAGLICSFNAAVVRYFKNTATTL